MSEPTIHAEIDNNAGLTYFELSSAPVAKTEEFTSEINVDLDQFGVVVGIESLSPAVPLDATAITRLAERYHVPSDIVDLLPVAIQAIRDLTLQSHAAVRTLESGVLYSSPMPQLTPCCQ